jgi:nucleotidyltransferase/DNA polymerase involved in DNA repair
MNAHNMQTYKNRAIVHMDGDAFFASVEQAKDWRLRGRPVITGGERFIAASMSYEAKARGVTRGMRISEIKKVCPEAIILPSDYVTYGIFARRMYNIVRTYTPHVEEYSIDECFADITGFDELMGISYEEIALMIKADLERKLGVTFGVGLAGTKVLAKAASKHRKPAGFTCVRWDSGEQNPHQCDRRDFLSKTNIEKVWGIGTSTTRHLREHGIMTALDFADLDSYQLSALSVAKPYREIHAELNGLSVMKVHSEKRSMPQSIMCTRSFTPPSRDPDIVFSLLSKNIEEACERLRHEKAKARACSFFIKSQEFRYYGGEHAFDQPTSDSIEIIRAVKGHFGGVFKSHLDYRATGITLRSLVPEESASRPGLFDDVGDFDTGLLYKNIDLINRKYGERTIVIGSSMRIRKATSGASEKVWELPYLGTVRGQMKKPDVGPAY